MKNVTLDREARILVALHMYDCDVTRRQALVWYCCDVLHRSQVDAAKTLGISPSAVSLIRRMK